MDSLTMKQSAMSGAPDEICRLPFSRWQATDFGSE
jgi:hypothetical protein